MSDKDNLQSVHGLPKSNGMTVPEGYFDDFARRMMERIPETVPVPEKVKLTTWQKIRPYVYMAAMFAGVYLLMNIFTLTAGIGPNNPDDSAPLFADLVNTNTTGYVDDYLSISDIDLYDDLYEAGYEIPESL